MVVRFACRFYVSQALLLYLNNKLKHCVNSIFVDAAQKSFSEATRSSIPENYGYTLKFAPNRMEYGRKSLSYIENVADTL